MFKTIPLNAHNSSDEILISFPAAILFGELLTIAKESLKSALCPPNFIGTILMEVLIIIF